MTYRCATSGLAFLGAQDREWPTIYCDGDGCGSRLELRTRAAALRMMDGKATRGWRTTRLSDFERLDLCPRCVAAVKGER